MSGRLPNLRWAFCLLLATVGLILGGCASPESANQSERPWNAPQPWEHGLPSGMGSQYR